MAVEQEATAKQEKGSTVAAAMVAGAEVEGVQRTASKEEVEVTAAAIEEKETSESAEAVRVGEEAAVDQVRAAVAMVEHMTVMVAELGCAWAPWEAR